jgi:hypothetical protein
VVFRWKPLPLCLFSSLDAVCACWYVWYVKEKTRLFGSQKLYGHWADLSFHPPWVSIKIPRIHALSHRKSFLKWPLAPETLHIGTFMPRAPCLRSPLAGKPRPGPPITPIPRLLSRSFYSGKGNARSPSVQASPPLSLFIGKPPANETFR